MTKYISIMLLAIVFATTTSKAQNSNIQWVTFEKEIPLNVNEFINVFNTADEFQGKKLRVQGTNIIYRYNIRPSVARTVFINNLVEMGFNVKESNVQDFILNHCQIGPWLPNKSAYKTANYFVNSQGNPVASGYNYNGGSGVWALWSIDYPNVPLEKVNCMQVQASEFRIKKQTPQTQYSAPIYVSATPVSNSTYQQPKTTNYDLKQTVHKDASWGFSVSGSGLNQVIDQGLRGNLAGCVVAGAGAISIQKEGAYDSQTSIVASSTGYESGFPDVTIGNTSGSQNNNGGCGAVTSDSFDKNGKPTWR